MEKLPARTGTDQYEPGDLAVLAALSPLRLLSLQVKPGADLGPCWDRALEWCIQPSGVALGDSHPDHIMARTDVSDWNGVGLALENCRLHRVMAVALLASAHRAQCSAPILAGLPYLQAELVNTAEAHGAADRVPDR